MNKIHKTKQTIKIALISLQQDAERVPPVGLVYLSTYMNEKMGIPSDNIKIFDKNFDDIEAGITKFNPDIIGFTSMTVNYGEIIQLARKLRAMSSALFILGGVHISTLPESLDISFDIGVIGEGEITLSEIIELYLKDKISQSNLKKIKGIIFHTNKGVFKTKQREPIENLDDLPIPNFNFVNPNYFKKDEIPSSSKVGIKCYLFSSRGCPYRCVFCSTSRFWGKMRLHSPDYTAKVVKRAIDDFKADYIKVMDDLFTISPQRLKEIKNAFEKYGILEKIKGIECQARANLMTDELCRAMRDIKIETINFGFESGSEKVLSWLKQNSVTVEMNRKAILMCKKYKFRVYGSLIYGSPNETIEDMNKTNKFIDFAIKNNARYLWSFVATPFPATPFWDIALKKGIVSNNMDWNLLSHHNFEKPMLLDDSVKKEDFTKVFLDGRAKLRWLKIRMIIDFLLKHPFFMILRIAKFPKYYFSRTITQLLKQ